MAVATLSILEQQRSRSSRAESGTATGRVLRALTTTITLGVSAVMLSAAGILFFLHVSVQPVLTGSMRPTYAPGWAIVSRAIPVSQIRPGMVVIFVPPHRSASYAHRVVSVSGSPDQPVITTKGDANPAADPWHARISAHSIQEVVWGVPWLGNAMVAMHGGGLRIVLIVTAGLFIAITGAQVILRTPRRRVSAPAWSSRGGE
jgi:signal peptidase I